MELWKSVGKKEETKENAGGLLAIMSLQFRPGCRQWWVATLLVRTPLHGSWGSFGSRELHGVASGPWYQERAKRGIFSSHSDSVSF